jgi:hypothetical protein
MENLGIFYDHLVYFRPIGSILWSFGIFVVIWYISPHFGILYQDKSGNPATDCVPFFFSTEPNCPIHNYQMSPVCHRQLQAVIKPGTQKLQNNNSDKKSLLLTRKSKNLKSQNFKTFPIHLKPFSSSLEDIFRFPTITSCKPPL